MLDECGLSAYHLRVLAGLNFLSIGHNTAAALLIDGHISCAISEERLNRDKHSSDFPWKSIASCLSFGGLKADDIDCVAFGWNYERFIRELYLERALHDLNQFKYLIRDNDKLSGFLQFGDELRERLNFKNQFRYYNHHHCHIAYSFRTCGFNEANVIRLDGAGEKETGVLGHYSRDGLREVCTYDFPNSLGSAYAALTHYLGFKHHCGEGIIMGLASYGKPQTVIPNKGRSYIDVFREILPADDKGNYQVNYDWLVLGLMKEKWVTEKFKELFGPVREVGSTMTQHHMNIAAALQLRLEEIVIAMAKQLHDTHPCPNLALTGGVALNCVMNSRIESFGFYKNIYIPPAPADNGVAVGACLECYRELAPSIAHEITFTQGMIGLGPSYSQERCRNAFIEAGLTAKEPSDLAAVGAEFLKQGKIIGWFEVRSEFGPRALGHRSILTRPYPAEMKDIRNSRVKFRE